MDLQNYYDEHAIQARQHENQRSTMTSMVLGVAGILVSVITYLELSLWTLPAAITLCALGVYGYVFSGKHYERNRYHCAILKAIREEMDRQISCPEKTKKTTSEIRKIGTERHYKEFCWPRFRQTNSNAQSKAKSWIARQHLHPFWEVIHLVFLGLGIVIIVSTITIPLTKSESQPTEIRIVK